MNTRIENLLHSNYEDEVFWMRLEEMPDIEALVELKLRRVEAVNAKASLIEDDRDRFVKQHTVAICAQDKLLTVLNEEIKTRNRRIDSVSWRNAVKAVCGEEAYTKCREWIIINGC